MNHLNELETVRAPVDTGDVQYISQLISVIQTDIADIRKLTCESTEHELAMYRGELDCLKNDLMASKVSLRNLEAQLKERDEANQQLKADLHEAQQSLVAKTTAFEKECEDLKQQRDDCKTHASKSLLANYCVDAMIRCLKIIQRNKMILPPEDQLIETCMLGVLERRETTRKLQSIITRVGHVIPDTMDRINDVSGIETESIRSIVATTITDFATAIRTLKTQQQHTYEDNVETTETLKY